MKWLIKGFLILACFLLSIAAEASRPAWEAAERMPGHELVAADEEASATVVDGYVYVAVRQTMQVKLFTILGQPLVQETLHPGIYRFRLPSRGIYLLKLGATTRRLIL